MSYTVHQLRLTPDQLRGFVVMRRALNSLDNRDRLQQEDGKGGRVPFYMANYRTVCTFAPEAKDCTSYTLYFFRGMSRETIRTTYRLAIPFQAKFKNQFFYHPTEHILTGACLPKGGVRLLRELNIGHQDATLRNDPVNTFGEIGSVVFWIQQRMTESTPTIRLEIRYKDSPQVAMSQLMREVPD